MMMAMECRVMSCTRPHRSSPATLCGTLHPRWRRQLRQQLLFWTPPVKLNHVMEVTKVRGSRNLKQGWCE